jgi:cation diffusion facilitator family transporter
MRYPPGLELPPTQKAAMNRAIRLEWWSVAYWISIITLLYFVLGSSQAMKAAWVEDILGLFPPIAFLVAARFRHRAPSESFPWGYHRAITVAYVVASFALFMLGLFIFVDSAERLLAGTHPSIGLAEVIDTQIWLGWVMIAALLYGVVPPLILGRMKRPLAHTLHDKVLFADAKMNQADWLTAAAAIGGILGIGLGLWWADAVAALIISSNILHDGQRYLRESVSDLMDQRAQTYDENEPHPLVADVREEISKTRWVSDGAVRVRELGHLLAVDAWVVPVDDESMPQRVEELTARLRNLDWRLHDVMVAPVRGLEDVPRGVRLRDEAPA